MRQPFGPHLVAKLQLNIGLAIEPAGLWQVRQGPGPAAPEVWIKVGIAHLSEASGIGSHIGFLLEPTHQALAKKVQPDYLTIARPSA